MGTKIGKLLVLANVFIAIGLLAWAVSIYTNRLSYFDGQDGETATKGQFTQYTDEMAQDTIAAMIAAGSHSGISFSYNDALNSLSATVSGAGTAFIGLSDVPASCAGAAGKYVAEKAAQRYYL